MDELARRAAVDETTVICNRLGADNYMADVLARTELVPCVYCSQPLDSDSHVRGCPNKPEVVWTVFRVVAGGARYTCYQADGKHTAHYRNEADAEQRAIELAGAYEGYTYQVVPQSPENAWMLTRLG